MGRIVNLGFLNWAPEHEAALRELIAGGYSAAMAADAINLKFNTTLSRNAVGGKIHRLGMSVPRGPNVVKITAAKRKRKRIKPVRAIAPDLEPVRSADLTPRYITLLALRPHDCRYPFGDGPWSFCGHRKLKGSSYCPEHFELSRRS